MRSRTSYQPVCGARYESRCVFPGRASPGHSLHPMHRLRSRPPQGQADLRVRPPSGEPHMQPLATRQMHAVVVDGVVPEVERRVEGRPPAPQLARLLGAVVRLETVGRRQRIARVQEVDRLGHVEAAPAAELVASHRTLVAAARGIDVVRVPLEDPRHLAARERRVDAEQDGRGRSDLRRRERGALGMAVVADRTVGVALRAAIRLSVRQGPREGGEDADARCGEVDEAQVLVREVGNVAGAGQSAHADHVGQRRRPARVRPRRRIRLVRVPDRGHDHRTLPHGVGHRLGLDLRVRVQIGIFRVPDGAEAEVDDPRPVLDGPADAGRLGLERDGAVVGDHLGHEQLGRVGDTDDTCRVQGPGDLTGDDRAVPLVVVACATADEALRLGDLILEIGQRAVDAGVDDRDLHGVERRGRVPGVERVVPTEVPLLVVVGVRRREGCSRGGRDQRSPYRADQRDPQLVHYLTVAPVRGSARARLRHLWLPAGTWSSTSA